MVNFSIHGVMMAILFRQLFECIVSEEEMTKSLLLKIMFLVLPATIDLLPAQSLQMTTPQDQRSYRFQILAGYNTFRLSEVIEFYQLVVNSFRDLNIPVPTQQSFPGNGIVELSLLLRQDPRTLVGFGISYSNTGAYSRYADYAGTLDISAKVDMLNIRGVFEGEVFSGKHLRGLINVQPGFVFGRTSLRQAVSLREYVSLRSSSALTALGNGFSMDAKLGLGLSMGRLSLLSYGGYRFALIEKLKANYSENGTALQQGDLQLRHNYTGLVFLTGLGFDF